MTDLKVVGSVLPVLEVLEHRIKRVLVQHALNLLDVRQLHHLVDKDKSFQNHNQDFVINFECS